MFKKKQKVVRQNPETDHKELLIDLESENNRSKMNYINTLSDVNELLMFMTSLDYVKAMINDANQQSELVEGVATGSEELSASTEDISNHVQRANRAMNDSIDETNQSLEKIDGTFLSFEEKINQTNSVKLLMDEVALETKKINEIVKVITDVAGRTNLLALNASIEAARSGEHGRGFSVVADEIKKLAENTRKEVALIQEIVGTLNEKTQRASTELDNVVLSLNESKAAMNDATSGMQGIKKAMKSVGDSFMEISANIEEQTAATQQMSASLMIINEKSMALKSESDMTGMAFYELSQKIDEIRLKALGSINGVDPSTMIDITITDHLMWKWKVYNMLLGYVDLESDKLGDHHSCRLGKWLNTLDLSDAKVNALIEKIEKPHSRVHENARNAVQAYEKKQVAESEQYLIKIEENSTLVVEHLKELKNILA